MDGQKNVACITDFYFYFFLMKVISENLWNVNMAIMNHLK